jgi:DNA-binding IclR family transcriptional regulator
VGKIILANLSDEDLNKYLRNGSFEKSAPNTITDIEQLKAELLVIKREGVAFENEESRIGISGIAAGVKSNDGGTIGSVFIMGSSARLTGVELERIKPGIKACVLKISRALGTKDSGESGRNIFQNWKTIGHYHTEFKIKGYRPSLN